LLPIAYQLGMSSDEWRDIQYLSLSILIH
jgi:hypothetical protein